MALAILAGWKEVIPVLRMDKVREGSAFAGTAIVVSFPLPSKLGTVVYSMCITFMVSLQKELDSATVAVIKHVDIPILRK